MFKFLIDNFTEKQVIKNLLLLKNKTIIMVTHRIDLLDKFDEIVKL